MASIIDKFVLLFESDIGGTKKDIADTDKAVDSLDDSVKETSASIDGMDSAFVGLAKTMVGVVAGMVALDTILDGVFANAERIDVLNDFAGTIGESVEELDAWGGAAIRAGGTAQGLQNDLSTLAREAQVIATKGESRLSPYLNKLGIDLLDASGKARSMLDVLPELAEQFEGMSAQESKGIGEKLGLDAGTIMLLQQGRRGVMELVQQQKEFGVATAEDAEIAAAYGDQMDVVKSIMRGLAVDLGSVVLPAFTAIGKGFQLLMAFARDNKPFVVTFFTALTAVILYSYLPAVASAAIATWAMIAPFLATAAAVAAVIAVFALVTDDIYNFITGGESLIGMVLEWVGSFELVRAALNFVGAAFDYVWNKISQFLKGSTVVQAAIWALTTAFQGWGLILDGIVESLGWVIDKAQQAAEFVGGMLGAGADAVSGALNQGATALASANASPLNAQTSNSITSSKSISKNQSVNINTLKVETQATDSEGIVRTIGVNLKTQMRDTMAEFDDGVAN